MRWKSIEEREPWQKEALESGAAATGLPPEGLAGEMLEGVPTRWQWVVG